MVWDARKLQGMEEQLPAAKNEGGRQLREGKVLIRTEQQNDVFFNPAQVFNRDLSLVAVKAFVRRKRQEVQTAVDNAKAKATREGKAPPEPYRFRGLTLLEPLAATGLRSLRYCLELPQEDLSQVLSGDIDAAAVATMKRNRAANNLTEDRMAVVCAEAVNLMHSSRMPTSLAHGHPNVTGSSVGSDVTDVGSAQTEAPQTRQQSRRLPAGFAPPINRIPSSPEDTAAIPMKDNQYPFGLMFDIIDIDPYGSCAEFLDAAVRSIRNGGMLCVTSTDMMILCGKDPGVAFYKYGGSAVKSRAIHEISLRLIVHAVIMTAARYRRIAIPLLSCSVDFYVRVFVEIRDSPILCKRIASHTAVLLQCIGCDNYVLAPFCSEAAQRRTLPGNGSESTAPKLRIASFPVEGESTCSQCQSRFWISGPMFTGPLYDEEFVDLCLAECYAAANTAASPAEFDSNPLIRQNNSEAIGLATIESDTRITAEDCDRPGPPTGDDSTAAQNEPTNNDATSIAGEVGSAEDSGSQDGVGRTTASIEALAEGVVGLSTLRMLTKITGLLTAIKEELFDCPLFFHLPSICHRFGIQMMRPIVIRSALAHLGYRVSHFHREPQAIKTDAPCAVFFDVIRAWAKHAAPPKENAQKFRRVVPLMQREIECSGPFVFDVIHAKVKAAADASSGVPKWLPNPEPNWGPGKRARPGPVGENDNEKDPKKRRNND